MGKIGFVFSNNVVIGQPVFATFASDKITFLDRITGLTRYLFIHGFTRT